MQNHFSKLIADVKNEKNIFTLAKKVLIFTRSMYQINEVNLVYQIPIDPFKIIF